MKTTTYFGAALAATLCVTVAMTAQDTQDAGAPSPEMIARMTPGPMHKKLEPLVGDWHMKGKWRMTPDAPWEEFEADVKREWILGGRFVHETVESEFMGQPFEAMGIIGYDNTREEFTNVWIENMSTGTWFTTGEMQEDKLVFEGENSNCMTGEKNCWSKSVVGLSRDNQIYKGYGKSEDGKEFQNMEMTATRK